VTSPDLPLLHHIFLPARDVQQRPYTSSLPYRANGDLVLVGAVPQASSPARADATSSNAWTRPLPLAALPPT
jgi:hypothetical protein